MRRLPTLSRRNLWLVPGLAVAVYASELAKGHGLGLVPVLAFSILPHLPVLMGIGQPHGRGQLVPRAVPLFNAMHHPVLPVALLGLAVLNVLPPFWLVAALAWLGHLVIDRGFGDGPRSAEGWRPGRGTASRETALRAPALV